MIPYDTSCCAEYQDGFILDETENNDTSLFVEGQNTLRDILEKRPEAEHGKLIRFSVFYKDFRHDVDWTTLPDNARPIRFRDGQLTMDSATGEQVFSWTGCRFGYQYTADNGRNVQEVQEL